MDMKVLLFGLGAGYKGFSISGWGVSLLTANPGYWESTLFTYGGTIAAATTLVTDPFPVPADREGQARSLMGKDVRIEFEEATLIAGRNDLAIKVYDGATKTWNELFKIGRLWVYGVGSATEITGTVRLHNPITKAAFDNPLLPG